ncbi:hypothetical protein CHLRE_10g461100v5 [Chlamydomonas reinhardtii]|uniref:Uncharacterized protein n=1 Tax=Chlamydomonas reinhardtii TaxID=3055 RepID=A8I167_CHLRE|nr:uncharacterized protein CHLRE_10g461100v5 [Chlamydomonas reinhardtii]PNW78017.1 hypothetical protein CHLRE_10g461100v5 [Chlamydomonas reinhardtii]|eukprot:XP_001698411.1 predicted protein [Chlamydomonas reinhardtii]
MASMSTKTVEEVVKDLTKLLEKCEGDGFEPGWWHAWNYLGDDCRCAGEGFEEVKKLLGTEQQALLERIREAHRESARQINEKIDQTRRDEIRKEGKPCSECCQCGAGEVYCMGTFCWGPPTGNGYSEADEYKCAACFRQWNGPVTTYHD